MSKLSMADLDDETPVKTRAKAEAEAHNALNIDGRKRLSVGKTQAMIFRTTPERKAQMAAIADFLSAGRPGKPVSLTEVFEMAIDALDRELRGGARKQ
jgi:hypothetical protein